VEIAFRPGAWRGGGSAVSFAPLKFEQEGQIMLDLAQDRLRLSKNLLNQSFSCAHDGEIMRLNLPEFEAFVEENLATEANHAERIIPQKIR
jgi:hypothetical protein